MKRRAGFTLIELIVAMAIVMVLGAVAYAAYMGIEAKSRDNAVIGLGDQLAANLAHYAALNNGAYPVSASAGWSTEMGSLGSYAEFPATQPSVLNNLAVYSDGATTFQIEFKAAGGTGTVYCRDLNGLGTLSAWNGGAGPWAGCP